jgi:protease-4
MKNHLITSILLFVTLFSSGCTFLNVNIAGNYSQPLHEHHLSGDSNDKILIIPIYGVISDSSKKGLVATAPSMLQEVVAHLAKAKEDDSIKAVLIKINSPGGTVTASDILYHEIEKFKKETNKMVVVMMMDFAASGGYYISLPADYIFAHPTTITGSVGVIFMRPKFNGLMEKIGVGMEVTKSGKDKDMGSPFKASTKEEKELFQNVIDNMATKFKEKVVKNRHITNANLAKVMTAQIFSADDALKISLIDKIGYLDDTINFIQNKLNISEKPSVIIYRRSDYSEDNIYNNATASGFIKNDKISLTSLMGMTNFDSGFYYILPNMLPTE